jgi:diguanylate cyclase (GGDEF)-like protein/PAS domain S-box-containing protein
MPRSAGQPTLPASLTQGENEALLQLIADNISDIVSLLDLNGRILFISASTRELLGIDAGALAGQPILNLISSADHEIFLSTRERALYSDDNHTVTVHLRHVNSSEVRVDLRLRALRNANNQPVELVMAIRDVSDHHALEIRLRDSVTTYRGILDSINEAVYVQDRNGCFLDVNEGALRMYGYPREFLIGHTPQPISAPGRNDLAQTAACIQKAYAGEPQRFEFWGLRSNGEVFPKEVRLYPGSYFGEKVVVAIAQDITERKAAEEAIARESRMNETLLRAASDGIHIMDGDGNLVQVNDAFCRMLGYRREELLGRNLSEWDKQMPVAAIRPAFAKLGESGMTLEARHCRRDGSEFDVEITTVPMEIEGKRLIYAAARDITERKRTEEALQLAAQIYQSSSEAMMVTDGQQRIVAINPAFTAMTGYSAAEALGNQPKMLSSGRQDAAFYQAMWTSLLRTGHWQGEIYNRRKNGEVYPEWLTINVIRDEHGEPHRYVALFSDITRKKASEELIWWQANFDSLTRLPNRRMFRDRLRQEIKKSQRNQTKLALLFIDLDRFKEVNDTMGHEAGDRLLVEAAHRISGCVRSSDTVARLGGDEFTVILTPLGDAPRIESVADTIIERLSAPFRLGHEQAYISASVGITLFPDDAETEAQLVKHADQAMYAAKSAGRNRFSYFTHALQEAAQARIHLIKDLRSPELMQQLQVYFQPIVELASGEIHKAEALVRWQHPQRGLVSPMDFIPLCEEIGLINQLGDWVFLEAARWASDWSARSARPVQISLNMSPVQFLSRHNAHALWESQLQQLGLSGANLVIEITEGLLLHADPGVTDRLLHFRDAGIQVAIDDFGTGYSSLAYLKKFDIDYLKIDKAFIHNLTTDSDDMALTEAIIVMAHKLGLKVIAEGVETDAQRQRLQAAGCDYAQGYLFSRPVPPEQFDALLNRPRA